MASDGKATIKDIAARAAVSLTTVHRALQGDRYVRAQTRQKVLAAAAALDYRPNAMAQGLRRNHSRVIGHIVHMLYPNPFFACVASGVEERARTLGFATLACNTHSSVQLERESIEVLLQQRVEAIVMTTPLREDNVQRVLDSGTAICVVEQPQQRSEVDTVLVDNRGGARDAVRALLELGHRAIAYVGARPGGVGAQERFDGYRDALRERGLEPQLEWTRFTGLRREDGYQAMNELLALPTMPAAALFAGDLPALGALQALWDQRRRVPDDLSIISIDDTLAAAASPPLTAMAIPMWEMGATAVDLVVRRAGSNAPLPAQQVVLPMRLVVRASCRPVAVTDYDHYNSKVPTH